MSKSIGQWRHEASVSLRTSKERRAHRDDRLIRHPLEVVGALAVALFIVLFLWALTRLVEQADAVPGPMAAEVRCDSACHWNGRWLAEPAGWRSWAKGMVACETRGTPWRLKAAKHDNATGYTYHGGPQFSYTTWRAAQKYLAPRWRVKRDPHKLKHRALQHQMVVAIELAQHEGTGHWPVCG